MASKSPKQAQPVPDHYSEVFAAGVRNATPAGQAAIKGRAEAQHALDQQAAAAFLNSSPIVPSYHRK
jgi:hypothetical protein